MSNTAQRNEEGRGLVLKSLYSRAATSLPVRGVRDAVQRDFGFVATEEEIRLWLEFWECPPGNRPACVKHTTPGHGTTRYYQITAEGQIYSEENP